MALRRITFFELKNHGNGILSGTSQGNEYFNKHPAAHLK
jgi:hypothetical protein